MALLQHQELYKQVLDETLKFLSDNEEHNWYDYFSESRALFERKRIRKSAKHTLSAFGGMGSYQDSPINGVLPDGYSSFDELRSALYNRAKRASRLW